MASDQPIDCPLASCSMLDSEESTPKLEIELERMKAHLATHLGDATRPGQIYALLEELKKSMGILGERFDKLRTHVHGGDGETVGISARMTRVEETMLRQIDAMTQLTRTIQGSESSPGLRAQLTEASRTTEELEKLKHLVLIGSPKEPSIMTLLDRIEQNATRTQKALWVFGTACITALAKTAFDLLTK